VAGNLSADARRSEGNRDTGAWDGGFHRGASSGDHRLRSYGGYRWAGAASDDVVKSLERGTTTVKHDNSGDGHTATSPVRRAGNSEATIVHTHPWLDLFMVSEIHTPTTRIPTKRSLAVRFLTLAVWSTSGHCTMASPLQCTWQPRFRAKLLLNFNGNTPKFLQQSCSCIVALQLC
jgi:hypothetical protein